jgi:N-acetylmuramoyl-L-alanine amidase
VLLASVLLGSGIEAGVSGSDGRVPALRGDGVLRLLRRHGLGTEADLQEFLRLNADLLGPNHHLIEGRRYELPRQKREVIEPLFGPDLARVEPIDDRLRGGVFYLVSGHGGPDPGGMGQHEGHTLYEDEYAYDVTLRLGRRLIEHGAVVHFIVQDPNDGIRDDRYLPGDRDELCHPGVKIPLNQRDRLEQRCAAVNRLARQDSAAAYRRCLEIHVDARRVHEDIDIFFYYQESSGASRRLANTLRETIRQKYAERQPGRGYHGAVSTRNLYVLRNVEVPLVFIELGNIHHPRDQLRLIDPNNRQAMANWLCEGLLADFSR